MTSGQKRCSSDIDELSVRFLTTVFVQGLRGGVDALDDKQVLLIPARL